MAKGKKPNTVQVATEIIRPVLEELGLSLWDVRFEKEGSSWYLRYLIDREDGQLTIQDCENASRTVSKLLDAADPIDQSYMLEVSSPGVERELVKDWHYDKYLGHPVTVRLIRPVDGVREFTGTLEAREGNEVAVESDGAIRRFLMKEAAYVRLHIDFETGGLEE